MDDENPTGRIFGQGAAHPPVNALNRKIDFTSDRNGGVGFRFSGAEGVPVTALFRFFGDEPYSETAGPEHPGFDTGSRMTEVNEDLFIRKGLETFYKLLLIPFDGLFILNDFQHDGPPGLGTYQKISF
jgi:hypothetical protein